MLFNSYFFILFFLPLVLILYYGMQYLKRPQAAKVVLILMSLWFYGYFHYSYILILAGSVLLNYIWSRWLLRETGQIPKKLILIMGICANVALIFYYKYWNFFADNVNVLAGGRLISARNILMPLGISFFTFQQISYIVDSYKGETRDYSFLDYVLFVTFFPQLIAGPIVLHNEMIPQFKEESKKYFDARAFSRGLYWFAIGLFKKVMIADTLGRGVDWGFAAVDRLSALEAVLISFLYTFQIYFDFSGYCDMASGIASMFHFDLPLNFNSPYKAHSIPEFWQRWHITLGRFLKQYIYIPLGGNRKGKYRTMLHVMIVFLVSGIWHGAAWTFILWGALHGAANVLTRIFRKQWDLVPRGLQRVCTFCFVNFAWILFRAESIDTAVRFMQRMWTDGSMALSEGFLKQFDLLEFTYLENHIGVLNRVVQRFPAVHLVLCMGIAGVIVFLPKNCHEGAWRTTAMSAVFVVLLMVWSILSLSSLSAFLYFNF